MATLEFMIVMATMVMADGRYKVAVMDIQFKSTKKLVMMLSSSQSDSSLKSYRHFCDFIEFQVIFLL